MDPSGESGRFVSWYFQPDHPLEGCSCSKETAYRCSYEGFSVQFGKPHMVVIEEQAINKMHFFLDSDASAYTIDLNIRLLFDVMFHPLASGSRFQRLRCVKKHSSRALSGQAEAQFSHP
jgi:hypothetical protein